MTTRQSTETRTRKARVGVVGATGNTGVELVLTLREHPHAELAFATSRGDAQRRLDEIDPAAPPVTLERLEDVDPSATEAVFLCLPHGSSAPEADRLHALGARVIDLSGDLRLEDEATHREIYGTERSEALVDATVYGLPELERDRIEGARVVSNPGCYATAVELALLPLAEAGRLGEPVHVDAKSGVSGAGRAATATTHFCSANEDVRPYKIGRVHRHVPEMEQTLAAAGNGARPTISFAPHLVPLTRGISASCLVRGAGLDEEAAREIYAERYAGEPFVRVLPAGESARILGAAHSNRAVVSVAGVPDLGWLVVTCAIDNLGKGAAGQAVQNMNLMLGFPETAGLRGS